MYKSEAQAYQAIRREWKFLRDYNQRAASIYQWELENQDRHPQIKRMIMHTMKVNTPIEDFHMALNRPESLKQLILRARIKISKYQLLLNEYKVNK